MSTLAISMFRSAAFGSSIRSISRTSGSEPKPTNAFSFRLNSSQLPPVQFNGIGFPSHSSLGPASSTCSIKFRLQKRHSFRQFLLSLLHLLCSGLHHLLVGILKRLSLLRCEKTPSRLSTGQDGLTPQTSSATMLTELHTVQSLMTLIFMNQTAMNIPNVIVIMTPQTRQFLTPASAPGPTPVRRRSTKTTSTDPLQSSVIDLRALLARWKDKHDLKVLIPSTIHPCIHHPSNKVPPRIAGPTKNAIINSGR